MSSSTGAYCQARARLDLATLKILRAQSAWTLERDVLAAERWLEGRAVKIVDGTGISMPHTPGQPGAVASAQNPKARVRLPRAKARPASSPSSSGALLEAATGNQHQHESVLFGELWSKLSPGDTVLADRAYCSYSAMAALRQRGVDTVVRLHQKRSSDFRAGRALGPEDRLVEWRKPKGCPATWSATEFAALPARLPLRMIRLRVAVPGFHTQSAVLVTTLVDPLLYPADRLRELYCQRWQVEVHFAQLKTTLGMDVLRCKSPAMIGREALMH